MAEQKAFKGIYCPDDPGPLGEPGVPVHVDAKAPVGPLSDIGPRGDIDYSCSESHTLSQGPKGYIHMELCVPVGPKGDIGPRGDIENLDWPR